MKLSKNILLWVLAVVLMVASAIYQKTTGPTYPMKGKAIVNAKEINYKLPRSSDEPGEDYIKVEVPDKSVTGEVVFKRFKSHDDWAVNTMRRDGDQLLGTIPTLDPAGKVMYHIDLINKNGQKVRLNEEPAILRYKGKVPMWVLLPHILFMFSAMVLSLKTGLHAIFGGKHVFNYALWTLILFGVGGFILGPIVQKYAFDAYWTGWPFGTDLTDNKTLAAFLGWVVALWGLKRNPENKWYPIIAAIIMLGVYLIPHSMLGSEIDYTKLPK